MLDDLAVSLYVEERNKALRMRKLKQNMFAYLGPPLKIGRAQRKLRIMLSLAQTIDTEDNPEKQCRMYPHGGFDNYSDCDEDFLYQQFKNTFKIMPFWVTRDIDEVTLKKVQAQEDAKELTVQDFIDGTVDSPCYRPCLSTKVDLRSLHSFFFPLHLIINLRSPVHFYLMRPMMKLWVMFPRRWSLWWILPWIRR